MRGARIIPGLRYHDAPAAIAWLCRAFGFERHLVVEGPDGIIPHAQLRLGDSMIMLGSVSPDTRPWARFVASVRELDGRNLWESPRGCAPSAGPCRALMVSVLVVPGWLWGRWAKRPQPARRPAE